MSEIRQPVSIRAIQAAVARRYNMTIDEMLAIRGHRGGRPRQIAMRLAAKLTDRTHADIARLFRRNRGAVTQAVNRIEGRAEIDPKLADQIASLERELSGLS